MRAISTDEPRRRLLGRGLLVLSRRVEPGRRRRALGCSHGRVIVPAIWWFEVRNLLLTGERHARIDPAGTAGFLADLETMSIGIDQAPVSEAVLALARRHRLTVYDAAYLELARRLGASLATLDRKLAAAARAAGVALVGA